MRFHVEHLEEVCRLTLTEGTTCRVDGLFEFYEFINDFRICYNPSQAQARHENLGERAEEDNLALRVHRFQRRQLFDIVADFAVRVVFQYDDVVLIDDIHEALRRSTGQVMPVGFWNSGIT